MLPPVRLHPHCAPPEKVQEASRRRVRQGLAPFLGAEETLAQLEQQTTLRPRSLPPEMEAWARHPDERIPIALASSAPLRLKESPARLLLYARALGDAVREGFLWTPLLDTLDTEGIWPTHWQKKVPGLSPEEDAGYVKPPESVLSPLRPWIQEQQTAEALLVLRPFRSPTLRNLLATEGRQFTPSLLDDLFPGLQSWKSLALNPHLQGKSLVHWYELLLQQLERGEPRSWQEASSPLAQAVLSRQILPPFVRQRLLEWLHREEARRTPVAAAYAVESVLLSLIREAPQEEKELRYFHELLRSRGMDSRHTVFLMERQRLPEDLLQQIARDYPRSSNIRRALARHPAALSQREVRKILENSRMKEVWEGLARTATPLAFRSAFQRLAALSPPTAARVLQKATEAQNLSLRQQDLLPLLGSEDAAVRLAAIRALHQSSPSSFRGDEV